MTTTTPFRFVKGGPLTDYDVFDRGTGEKLGSVRRFQEHYNLARPLTVTYWRAWPIEGEGSRQKFSTRAEAAEALRAGEVR